MKCSVLEQELEKLGGSILDDDALEERALAEKKRLEDLAEQKEAEELARMEALDEEMKAQAAAEAGETGDIDLLDDDEEQKT